MTELDLPRDAAQKAHTWARKIYPDAYIGADRVELEKAMKFCIYAITALHEFAVEPVYKEDGSMLTEVECDELAIARGTEGVKREVEKAQARELEAAA